MTGEKPKKENLKQLTKANPLINTLLSLAVGVFVGVGAENIGLNKWATGTVATLGTPFIMYFKKRGEIQNKLRNDKEFANSIKSEIEKKFNEMIVEHNISLGNIFNEIVQFNESGELEIQKYEFADLYTMYTVGEALHQITKKYGIFFGYESCMAPGENFSVKQSPTETSEPQIQKTNPIGFRYEDYIQKSD